MVKLAHEEKQLLIELLMVERARVKGQIPFCEKLAPLQKKLDDIQLLINKIRRN